jgi:iron complex outermembrane receptor protein
MEKTAGRQGGNKMKMKIGIGMEATCIALVAGLAAMPAVVVAQNAPEVQQGSESQLGEVVVTARKRQESEMSVPVSVTAFSAQQIESQAMLNMFDIALRDPTISVDNNVGTTGGGIYLRGIGTNADVSGTLEQSVSLDIDGAPISRGNALRVGQYDLGQIEILKGPQALFFGKDSSAGVIAFRSKDPTSELETSAKLSYEPYSANRFAEMTLSGPLSDALRARVFVHTSATDGEKDNLSYLGLPANNILPGSVIANPDAHAWANNETFLRGTVVFEPNERFRARLTSSYDALYGEGLQVYPELSYCPQGRPQTATLAYLLTGGAPNTAALAKALAVDDCKLNGTVYAGGINPAFLTAPGLFTRDPAGGSRSDISISTAELTYRLVPGIDLTSVSSYARIEDRDIDDFTWMPASLALITYYNYALQSQFTEEVRATSKFSSPVNFMIGTFYEKAYFNTYAQNAAIAPYNVFEFHIPNNVYSGFAQALWDITSTLELAAGVRQTSEEKSLLLTRDGVAQPAANPKGTFNNTSPEVTLTWRPSSELTAYAAYKSGFKSGGYAQTVTGNGPPLPSNPPMDFLYSPEKVNGFEGGLKVALLDRSLRVDTTVYDYKYSNLQESSYDVRTGVPVLRVLNAASARQEGIEINGAYALVQGLQLTGMVNYNRSYFLNFVSPCFTGQSIAEGCNLNLNSATGVFTSQSLAGRSFTNAPLWVGALGFSYGRHIGKLRFELGADATAKSSYNASSYLSPGGVQNSFAMISGQVRLMSQSGSWEIGIFGKNLTNIYRSLDSLESPLSGNSTATGTVNGGVMARADLASFANPGRAVFIQLVIRPGIFKERT